MSKFAKLCKMMRWLVKLGNPSEWVIEHQNIKYKFDLDTGEFYIYESKYDDIKNVLSLPQWQLLDASYDEANKLVDEFYTDIKEKIDKMAPKVMTIVWMSEQMGFNWNE